MLTLGSMKASVKVYIAMYLCRGEWVPLGEIPHAFCAEENAWRALEIAFGHDPLKQAVISIDENLFDKEYKEWALKRSQTTFEKTD